MTWGRCRICDRRDGSMWESFVIRVLHIGRLELAPVRDYVCRACLIHFSRQPLTV